MLRNDSAYSFASLPGWDEIRRHVSIADSEGGLLFAVAMQHGAHNL